MGPKVGTWKWRVACGLEMEDEVAVHASVPEDPPRPTGRPTTLGTIASALQLSALGTPAAPFGLEKNKKVRFIWRIEGHKKRIEIFET